MNRFEACAAIDRLNELQDTRALPAETLFELDRYWRDVIFGDNDFILGGDRDIVQDYYIRKLRSVA